MAMNYRRRQTLVPWYHQPKPRCVTLTLAQERCTYSATFEDPAGRIQVCKIHRDMMPPEIRFRLIKTTILDIRDDRPALSVVRNQGA